MDIGRRPLTQSMTFEKGYPVVRDRYDGHGRPQSAAPPRRAHHLVSSAPYACDGEDSETGVHAAQPRHTTTVHTTGSQLPPWLTYDRKVMRFYAYFKEPVPDSPLEHWRVRLCHLLHYLEDGSTQVEEPKEDNSGLRQGTILRRHRVLLGNGAILKWSDFAVGSAINLYSCVYHIYACDAFTRDLLTKNGLPQAADEPAPTDPYHMRLQEKENMRETKPLVEQEERVPDAKQYFDNVGKVLRFWACWDNSRRPHGDKMPFVIHYFLADDSMEVREVRMRNDGRDPFPLLVRRMRLPKQVYSVGARPMSEAAKRRNGMEYYSWRDLAIGKHINIFGRDMLLTSADDFTQRWYSANAGVSESSFDEIEVDYLNRPKRPEMDAPPDVMGIGRDEDTIGNVKSLVPKPPKQDLDKLERYGSQALRFIARFCSAPGYALCGPADKERVFVVSFFLATDEIFVFEPPVRNTGILGGKFFERAKAYKPGTRTYYSASDFYVGAQIPLVSRLLELVDADAWTLEYMEKHPAAFPWASYEAVLWRLKRAISAIDAADALRDGLIAADADGCGRVPYRRGLMRARGLDCTMHEVITLARQWNAEGDTIPVMKLLNAFDLREGSGQDAPLSGAPTASRGGDMLIQDGLDGAMGSLSLGQGRPSPRR